MSVYKRADYVKVEFTDETTDDEKRLVHGKLDSGPLNDYGGQLSLGSELAVSFSRIREHRKASDFTKQ